MIPGFNHNIQHRGKTYHIQTEDSGLENPHIITLLYLGGNIIGKKKTSYAALTQVEQLPTVVRELMEEQHKAMLRELVKGRFDSASADVAVTSSAPPEESLPSVGTPASPSVPPPAGLARTPLPPSAPAPAAYVQAPEIQASEIDSLFGGGKEEKSLDEIILNYLSEG